MEEKVKWQSYYLCVYLSRVKRKWNNLETINSIIRERNFPIDVIFIFEKFYGYFQKHLFEFFFPRGSARGFSQ